MWRNKFHITPKNGLLNDPNGLIFYKGEYHVFYQLNPHECEHGAKYWGHVKSKDLIEWVELPIALEPIDWFDKNGCYSGSAIEKDGELYLLYTGNVKEDGKRFSYQCLAKSADGITFEKLGPVIHDTDIPVGYTRHFRDPKVSFNGNKYEMVIGAQRENLTGTVIKYISLDLFKWEFVGELLEKDFGFMCECPDDIIVDEENVLLFSPQGIESKGDLYNNRYQSGYIINGNENIFIEIDKGFEFYAPQTFLDKNGNNILIGWIGMPEELDHPTSKKENWIHSLTLPRVLKLKEKKLYQIPHENLKKLRQKSIYIENLEINEKVDLSSKGIFGETYELNFNFDRLKSGFEINLRVSEKEKTTLKYNFSEKKFILNRENSGIGYKGSRACKIDEIKSLQIFMDRSVVEIYLNNGEEVFTGNIYPSKNSLGIEIIGDSSFIIPKIEFYKI